VKARLAMLAVIVATQVAMAQSVNAADFSNTHYGRASPIPAPSYGSAGAVRTLSPDANIHGRAAGMPGPAASNSQVNAGGRSVDEHGRGDPLLAGSVSRQTRLAEGRSVKQGG
jgi:hypothetical protein